MMNTVLIVLEGREAWEAGLGIFDINWLYKVAVPYDANLRYQYRWQWP